MFSIKQLVSDAEAAGHRVKDEVEKLLGEAIPPLTAGAEDLEAFLASPLASAVEDYLGLPASSQQTVADVVAKVVAELKSLASHIAPEQSPEPAASEAPADGQPAAY